MNRQKPIDILHDLLPHFISLGRTDTLYRDVYLQRAQFYLEKQFSRHDYLNIKRMRIREASLPNQIRNAMNQGDWGKVEDLSELYKRLQEEIERKTELEDYARKIYEQHDTPIDPFSPGMHQIAGFSSKKLPNLCSEALRSLEKLAKRDRGWREFYIERQAVFIDLTINPDSLATSQAISEDNLKEAAAEALAHNNMEHLAALAKKLAHTSGEQELSTSSSDLLGEIHKVPDAYDISFSERVLKNAAALGLEHIAVPSRKEEYAPYRRFAWHPTYADMQGNHRNVLQVPDLPLPKELPEALKARIQLFAIHPFINSCGVRFLPNMIAEDVLVEGFPEPGEGAPLRSSGLLEALGIKQRNQLSRIQIEMALQEKGVALLRNELGLDPLTFKLVCIPPDLHLRIGQARGWGQQKVWTHFDGYMIMANGTRRALAGGDIRYGGIYDLLGISNNYD